MNRYDDEVDSYDAYIGVSSLFVSVDIEATVAACVKLIDEPALRAAMGRSARERVKADFDWSVVVRAYQDTWAEAATVRRNCKSESGGWRGNPRRADPYWLFERYPTRPIEPAIVISATGDLPRRGGYYPFEDCPLLNYGRDALPPARDLKRALAVLRENGPMRIDDLARHAEIESRTAVLLAAFLSKAGAIQLETR